MPKNLVIVESPAKARTIEGYLGKDFKVVSSYGHIRDLPTDDKAIDVDNGFAPTYIISKDKKAVVKSLKQLVKQSEMVYLASDDDREGEAISWHLIQALDLDEAKTRRIVFHEITKSAITNALKSPRSIDIDLVNAQQARRVLDRLVGYEISPILWRKIKTGLSAGRVQSVAVRLVVDREREIEGFNSKSSFKITADFDSGNGRMLKAELPDRFSKEIEAEEFLQKCIGAEFSITDLQKKPLRKSPAPPFTTSTLQHEASRKLGFSVARTMTLAQKLYESGKISYMRTDSVNLSEEALTGARNKIIHSYGERYTKTRRYKTKSAGAQEAHEAIRPTSFGVVEAGEDHNVKRLYDLIWKRAIASQMAEAELEKTIVTISVSTTNVRFIASGEVINFDGFLKVYIESRDEEIGEENQKSLLPSLEIGLMLKLIEMSARQGFSRPSARYTEASLVKKLEEMGIGRPSTYAPTISTIQKRNYVIKENRSGKERSYKAIILKNNNLTTFTNKEITGAEKNKLFPTDMGIIVNDFLVEHFSKIVDFQFTANVEIEFDEIAQGQKSWNAMIGDFYGEFHTQVEETKQIKSGISKPRELGVDPETSKKVYARMGKFGPVVQLGETDGDEKPRYTSLRKGQLIETIKLEEALELFRLPRAAGQFEDQEMIVGIGKYGPYIRHDGKFYSLDPGDDPYVITEERAIELILEKRKSDSNKIIKTFDENPDIQVLNGIYGPYIKAGKKNVKIPKGKDPASLSLDECIELAEKTPDKKRPFRKRRS